MGCDGRNGCREAILLVKDHKAIYNASSCEHQNRDHLASIWMKIAQEMGVGKWSALVFCFFDDDDVYNNKNNNNTSNSNNVLIVIRPSI
jgi:Alcohol dehydrogenase transcription factor Myb/SANT-like.